MNRIATSAATAVIATITLAVTTLAVPTLASAQEPKAGPKAENAVISANGHLPNRLGWLTTLGPDAQGRYTVSINVADIDASSPAGRAAIASRVDRGVDALCDMTADGPQIAGFYDAGARQCRAETRAAALTRLGARVSGGQHVSMLTLGSSSTAR